MFENKLIGPVDVLRDNDSWCYHSAVPDFEGSADPVQFYVWIEEQGLEIRQRSMEGFGRSPVLGQGIQLLGLFGLGD